MSLTVSDLSISYGDRRVLTQLELVIPKAAVTFIIGPNGCGKSTLLRGLGGLVAYAGGEVLLEGEPVSRIGAARLSRRLTMLPQSPIAPEGIRVAELVSRGRTPWLRRFRPLSAADRAAVDQAMADTGIADLRDRPVMSLSGGQRQRVWIAMALAQDTDWLLLDEPTTWLDLPHQLEVLKLVRSLNRELGRSVVISLHDISLAARFADHIIALRAGRLVAAGPAGEVITAQTLRRLFDLEAEVIADPLHGTPLVLPH
jgi:iron complex transport system ATP-binding protein